MRFYCNQVNIPVISIFLPSLTTLTKPQQVAVKEQQSLQRSSFVANRHNYQSIEVQIVHNKKPHNRSGSISSYSAVMEFSAINHLLRLGKIYVCGCPVLICSICSWMFGLLLDLLGNRPINTDVHTYCMMNILLEQGRKSPKLSKSTGLLLFRI